jgi:hypothetical protein
MNTEFFIKAVRRKPPVVAADAGLIAAVVELVNVLSSSAARFALLPAAPQRIAPS